MAQDIRKLFMKQVVLCTHGLGLVIREINAASFRKSLPKYQDMFNAHLRGQKYVRPGARGRPGAVSASMKSVAKMVKKFKEERRSLASMCTTVSNNSRQNGLSRNFVRRSLAVNTQDALRDDSTVFIAYTLVPGARRGGWEWRAVGIATYGAADKESTEGHQLEYEAPGLQDAVKDGRIVEIDLVCAKGASSNGGASGSQRAPQGTGSLLLAFCLAKAAMMKRKKIYHFRGAVLHTAGNPVTSAMGKVAARYGFVRTQVTEIVEGGNRNRPNNQAGPSTTRGQLEKALVLFNRSNNNFWVSRASQALPDRPDLCKEGPQCI